MPREITGVTVGEVRAVSDMHQRKSEMARQADAFIALPGGCGTLEELLEVITWAQLGIHRKPVTLLLLVALSHVVEHCGADYNGQCKSNGPLKPRPHSVSILEFGAVGYGKALNTVAFQNAIFYLKSFTDKGGARLYVPPGKWLTGSFNLTSHLTLFLEKDAIILGSQDIAHWGVVDALPSYGRGTAEFR